MEQAAPHRLAERTHLGRYLSNTAQPVYSLLFLLPLLVTYEALALAINFDSKEQLRNGADIIMRYIAQFLGISSMFTLMVTPVLVTIVLALVYYRHHKEPLQPKLFAFMFAESMVYAFCIGGIALRLASLFIPEASLLSAGAVPGNTFATRLMISLGAGVYEEIVFRAFLIWLLLAAFQKGLRIEKSKAIVAAVLVAALLFSGFHHVGKHGEVFRWAHFVFRFMAGLILSLLYVSRGLGITAWSHSLYDVFVMFGLV